MKLKEAVAAFERGFERVLDGEPVAYMERGDKRYVYRTICSGGERLQGDVVPILAATEEIAASLWLEAARCVQTPLDRFLYWRVRPEIDWVDAGPAEYPTKYAAVYSRFLTTENLIPDIVPEISARPVREKLGDLVVSDGRRGFVISLEDVLDNWAPVRFTAGLKALQEKEATRGA
jgi:hypothetical protein